MPSVSIPKDEARLKVKSELRRSREEIEMSIERSLQDLKAGRVKRVA